MRIVYSPYQKIIFLALISFLLLGNVVRLLPIKASFGNLNLMEPIVYAVCIPYGLARTGRLIKSKLLAAVAALICCSFLIGLVKWGFDVIAFSYAIRLLLQIISSAALGIALAESRGMSTLRLMQVIVAMYGALSLISLIILIAFPDSQLLWAILSSEGVDFIGDPHVGRLVSTYFDPNFFAAIIVFPLMIGFLLYAKTKSKFILLNVCLMASALALTYSRSGISLLVLLIGGSLLYKRVLFPVGGRQLLKIAAALLFVGLLISFTSVTTGANIFERLQDRFFAVENDASALARLESFNIGNDLIAKEPLLGFGYNYGLEAASKIRGIGLDSSVQTIILNFGAIPALFMLAVMVINLININGFVRRRSDRNFRALWVLLNVYIFLAIFWAGNFNEIVFYPFWVVPVFILLFYYEFSKIDSTLNIDGPRILYDCA